MPVQFKLWAQCQFCPCLLAGLGQIEFPFERIGASGWVPMICKGIDKATALGEIAQRLGPAGIAVENCIAFGDGLNDIGMLKCWDRRCYGEFRGSQDFGSSRPRHQDE